MSKNLSLNPIPATPQSNAAPTASIASRADLRVVPVAPPAQFQIPAPVVQAATTAVQKLLSSPKLGLSPEAAQGAMRLVSSVLSSTHVALPPGTPSLVQAAVSQVLSLPQLQVSPLTASAVLSAVGAALSGTHLPALLPGDATAPASPRAELSDVAANAVVSAVSGILTSHSVQVPPAVTAAVRSTLQAGLNRVPVSPELATALNTAIQMATQSSGQGLPELATQALGSLMRTVVSTTPPTRPPVSASVATIPAPTTTPPASSAPPPADPGPPQVTVQPIRLTPPATNGPAAGVATNESIDSVMQNEFAALETWGAQMSRSSRIDFGAYLATKFVIFSGSIGAILLEHHGMGNYVPALGGVCTMITALDTIRPAGTLYKAHRMAAQEVQILLENARSTWQMIQVQYPANQSPEKVQLALQVLQQLQDQREEISRSVTSSEAKSSDDQPTRAPLLVLPTKH